MANGGGEALLPVVAPAPAPMLEGLGAEDASARGLVSVYYKDNTAYNLALFQI